MKKISTIVAVVMVTLTNAQAYKGKGDIKAQVGFNAQNHGTGINVSADFGIGENMSYGFVASYLLSVDDFDGVKPKFEDRADVKVRFNANLGNVFKLDKAIDTVIEKVGKSNRNKYRAIVYYLLVKELGQESKY